MSRFIKRVMQAAPLYGTLCAALVTGGVVFALAGPDQPAGEVETSASVAANGTAVRTADPGATAATAPAESYCYAWDFTNSTGQDVDGLSIRLSGVQSVTQVYMGPENPFGTPDATSGFNVAANVYTLNFGGIPVANGETTQVGLCTSQPLLALDPSKATSPSPFVWRAGGVPLATPPLFAGLQWQWVSHNQLEVHVTGDAAVSMTLLSLSLLDAGTKLELDDLNGPAVAGLPMVAQFVTDTLSMDPGATDAFGVAVSAPFVPGGAVISSLAELDPNHPYVIEAVLASQNDPGNTIHLYSQTFSPWATVYVPIALSGK